MPDEATQTPAEPPAGNDYPCKWCGKTHRSRQARHGHEKTCRENPANKPADTPAAEAGSIEENRKKYEEATGTSIPAPDLVGEPIEPPEPDADFGFDPVIALIGVLILLIVGCVVLREKIVAAFARRPPQGGGFPNASR